VRIIAVLLTLGSAALGVQAQVPQPPIRSGVELVAVDVQVVARDGAPVSGLTAADFEIAIDNHIRRIASVDLIRYATSPPGTAAVDPAAPGVPAAAAVPAAPRRMFILAVDEHSLRVGSARAAVDAAKRFVDRLGRDDLVALRAYPTGTAQTDLTNDHAVVRAALDRVMALYDRPRSRFNLTASDVIDIASADRDALARAVQRECPKVPACAREIQLEAEALAVGFEMQIAQSLGGLRGLIHDLAAVPGRKTLVLVSGGLLVSDRSNGRVNASGQMMDLGRDAALSHATVYALHLDDSFLDAFSAERPTRNVSSLFRDSSMFASGLEMVAGAAGGDVLRVQGTTPDKAFDRILRETSAYYLVGVEPADADRDGKPHYIRVKVKAPGAAVRSRTVVVIPREKPS
jgi:VWFA-related protein